MSVFIFGFKFMKFLIVIPRSVRLCKEIVHELITILYTVISVDLAGNEILCAKVCDKSQR